MLSCPVFSDWIRISPPSDAVFPFKNRRGRSPFSNKSFFTSRNDVAQEEKSNKKFSGVHYDSLKVLEWDKVCDLVASFASTSPGRDATKAHLWDLHRTYEDSLKLLEETNAAVEMHKHGGCRLYFTGLQLHLVTLAVQNARRSLAVGSNEAVAVAVMLELVEVLQLNLKAAVKEDGDWYNRFMPLSQVIMELVTNRPLVRTIRQVVDEDGSVKDSASPALKRSQDQVRILEKKLSQLIDSLIRREMTDTSFLEASNVDGRWCIRSGTGQLTRFKGLLLSSDSGKGSILEPLVAVPLNDDLQEARASAAKAETDVLWMLTEKMQKDLGDIEKTSNNIIQLDVINARATYSLSFGGACPALYLPEETYESSTANAPMPGKKNLQASSLEWILYMPKAYHSLMLQQYRLNLRKAQKAGNNATTVSAFGVARPIAVDFFIAQKTKVLVITGPNTGGKTICLKTVGLAAVMAKSGLYVLSSESVQIPWFDSVFADIGDEQSLSQSLSTFSGHLRQISNIKSQSTSQSLVLLDEVGAGTNPLEGAALGMALLESFAYNGALLTIATTHHGELKSLKYRNDAFENACMEFDESSLRPTYKILWGIPVAFCEIPQVSKELVSFIGRSNAINISERLGLPNSVIYHARELYGATNAELNEVIVDMEKFKQDFQGLLYESQHYLMMSRNLYANLLCAQRKILDHGAAQRYWKMQKLSETASLARSTLHKKVRERRASATHNSQDIKDYKRQFVTGHNQLSMSDKNGHSNARSSSWEEIRRQSPSVRRAKFPEVGDVVQVSSLGKKGTVLRVDPSKDEILIQAGIMRLKVKLSEILA